MQSATKRRGSVLSGEIVEHRRGLGEAHLVAAGDRVVSCSGDQVAVRRD